MWFNINKFTEKLAEVHGESLSGVISHEEQFGALCASLIAEKLNLPGTNPDAILKLQHKVIFRYLVEQVAPESNIPYKVIGLEMGDTPKLENLEFPFFFKPAKASFSVLAKQINNFNELREHMSFGPLEGKIIRRLVKPFNEICQARLPGSPNAAQVVMETPVDLPQFNLDGFVFQNKVHFIGVIDEIMYPGTKAFQRFGYPSNLAESAQKKAFEIAIKILNAAGFDHGFFNMEFFYDEKTDSIRVIEINPRLASQLADLYERVDGLDVHGMAMAMALGGDPHKVPHKKLWVK